MHRLLELSWLALPGRCPPASIVCVHTTVNKSHSALIYMSPYPPLSVDRYQPRFAAGRRAGQAKGALDPVPTASSAYDYNSYGGSTEPRFGRRASPGAVPSGALLLVAAVCRPHLLPSFPPPHTYTAHTLAHTALLYDRGGVASWGCCCRMLAARSTALRTGPTARHAPAAVYMRRSYC